MAKLDIAIDFGTSYTAIYLSGNGIVLREPSIVAFNEVAHKSKIRAVGDEAIEMLGKTPEKTILVSPIKEGLIVQPDVASIMLKEFIERIIPDNLIFNPRIRAIIGVPMGLSLDQRLMYEQVCFNAGIKEVIMVENIVLSAIGSGMPINSCKGGMIVSIGGGVTDIAVISLGGIISGSSILISGDTIDKALLDYIVGSHNIKLGLNTVRKLKKDIGTLYQNDISVTKVTGIDVRTKSPSQISVKAQELEAIFSNCYMNICDSILTILNKCPPEIASDIYNSGITFCGGGSLISGLQEKLSKKLDIPCNVDSDPEYTLITGGGKLLSDMSLLNIISQQN